VCIYSSLSLNSLYLSIFRSHSLSLSLSISLSTHAMELPGTPFMSSSTRHRTSAVNVVSGYEPVHSSPLRSWSAQPRTRQVRNRPMHNNNANGMQRSNSITSSTATSTAAMSSSMVAGSPLKRTGNVNVTPQSKSKKRSDSRRSTPCPVHRRRPAAAAAVHGRSSTPGASHAHNHRNCTCTEQFPFSPALSAKTRKIVARIEERKKLRKAGKSIPAHLIGPIDRSPSSLSSSSSENVNPNADNDRNELGDAQQALKEHFDNAMIPAAATTSASPTLDDDDTDVCPTQSSAVVQRSVKNSELEEINMASMSAKAAMSSSMVEEEDTDHGLSAPAQIQGAQITQLHSLDMSSIAQDISTMSSQGVWTMDFETSPRSQQQQQGDSMMSQFSIVEELSGESEGSSYLEQDDSVDYTSSALPAMEKSISHDECDPLHSNAIGSMAVEEDTVMDQQPDVQLIGAAVQASQCYDDADEQQQQQQQQQHQSGKLEMEECVHEEHETIAQLIGGAINDSVCADNGDDMPHVEQHCENAGNSSLQIVEEEEEEHATAAADNNSTVIGAEFEQYTADDTSCNDDQQDESGSLRVVEEQQSEQSEQDDNVSTIIGGAITELEQQDHTANHSSHNECIDTLPVPGGIATEEASDHDQHDDSMLINTSISEENHQYDAAQIAEVVAALDEKADKSVGTEAGVAPGPTLATKYATVVATSTSNTTTAINTPSWVWFAVAWFIMIIAVVAILRVTKWNGDSALIDYRHKHSCRNVAQNFML
jgi:hypothetical protein